LKNQISAGLNFSLSGIPYWNSDIGGFFLWNYLKGLADPDYRELYVRWIQFGALCPMMRSHGTDAPREIYQFGRKGEKVFDAIERAIALRYALLPYIYSASWDVTARQSTMMRALVMDFANDKSAININDEYMFGKSLLVCPVTHPMYIDTLMNGKDTVKVAALETARNTTVYLPAGTEWYDFWTGTKHAGGKSVVTPAPIDVIPLYVRTGSILPIGPNVQYATEKPWDNLEIRIYAGANGAATLYEDEGDGYNYEKGIHSTIAFTWNDATRVLTIGAREGSFPGMPAERTFRIVMVTGKKGNGIGSIPKADVEVKYAGAAMAVHF
jgi:alpha-D-xyloside xylohydrolase